MIAEIIENTPPKLEKIVGLEVYATKTEGIGGKIKKLPEDFIVEEIYPEDKILSLNTEDKNSNDKKERTSYVHFTLWKYNWDTLRAIREISKRLRVSRKRFGFSGTKDKRAITTQRVSLWNVPIENLMKIKIKDIEIRDPKYEKERINLGDLLGNRFTITIREIHKSENEIKENINATIKELNFKIPGFFGLQRFGIQRPITHLVGKEILKKNFKEAVMLYLAEYSQSESEKSRNARKFLLEKQDFREAIKIFPKNLSYEITMLNHLIKAKNDYIGALRKLPKKLRLMFIHAYQAYIFNKALSFCIKKEIYPEKLPLVGYKSNIDEITEKILENEGIKKEDFLIKEMPEMSSEGSERDSFFEFKDFEILAIADDEFSKDCKKVVIKFSLPKGAYATILLRELMKNEYW